MGRRWHYVNFLGAFAALFVSSICWAAPDAGSTAAPAPTSAPATTSAPARARFTVVPFVNDGAPRTLDFLQAALPALVTERLGRHPGLRFTGPESIVERTRLDDALTRAAAAGTRFVVSGRFEKRPSWKIAVTVDVYAGANPANVLGEAQVEGSKDDVARTALLAAIGAMEKAGVATSEEVRARVLAPFARDAYAFVL
jgi:hypothetical protein